MQYFLIKKYVEVWFGVQHIKIQDVLNIEAWFLLNLIACRSAYIHISCKCESSHSFIEMLAKQTVSSQHRYESQNTTKGKGFTYDVFTILD